MRQNWGYSLLMLGVYVSLFLVWMMFPSRAMFLVGGFACFFFLLRQFRVAADAGYFVNPVDRRLHALVLIDVFLETLSFEFFRFIQPLAVVEAFHANTNFVGCASAFTLLIGGYRYWMSRKAIKVTEVGSVAHGPA